MSNFMDILDNDSSILSIRRKYIRNCVPMGRRRGCRPSMQALGHDAAHHPEKLFARNLDLAAFSAPPPNSTGSCDAGEAVTGRTKEAASELLRRIPALAPHH